MSVDTRTTTDVPWCVPGVPLSRVEQGPSDDVAGLVAAVESALRVRPAGLPEGQALERARQLLVLQERLHAVVLPALADVADRELHVRDGAGSVRTWLRAQPSGDSGQLAAARLLAERPVLSAALGEGRVSLRTALTVARGLEQVPAAADETELAAVLVDGVADVLAVWTGSADREPDAQREAELQERRHRLAQAVTVGLQDGWGTPADRLEPALALVAEVLTPAETTAAVALLVDALQPEVLTDRTEQQYRSRDLVLRKLGTGGWSLRAHLTDETGQLLLDALTARHRAHPLEPSSPEPGPLDELGPEALAAHLFGDHTREGADHDTGDTGHDTDPGEDAPAGAQDPARVAQPVEPEPAAPDPMPGAADPPLADPTPADPPLADRSPAGPSVADPSASELHGAAGRGGPPPGETPADTAVRGTPLPSAGQRAHDALLALLHDLTALPHPGSGAPAPTGLVVTATSAALDGAPGALPAQLHTGRSPVPLPASTARRLGCHSTLTAVLLDAARRPVAVSGTHRHATARERTALRAAWGSGCGVHGCEQPGTVPHHAEPWWKTRATRLADLVPLCEHHHHDLHDGRKALRLRDGRSLDETGWRTDPRWA